MHPLICMWIIAAGVGLIGGAVAYAGACLAFAGVLASALWWQDAGRAALSQQDKTQEAPHGRE